MKKWAAVSVNAIHRMSLVDVWAVFLSLGWLLPNHYLPWIAFHTDAWIAWMLVLIGARVVIRSRDHRSEWTELMVVASLVTVIPFIQYAGGVLDFSGQAWVTTAYLIGFLASLMLGYRWEMIAANEALNALFFAICFACLVSVGMQLYQWLSLDGLDLWIVNMAGNRPFANLVQPNQLGTFLFWGLIGIGWFVHQKKLGVQTAVFMAMFFLAGIALTRSRTTTFAIGFGILAAWYWRSLWFTKIRMQIVVGLIAFFLICQLSIGPISNALLLSQPFDEIARISGTGVRFDAYRLFIDAAMQMPLSGFGWTNLSAAQMLVAERHPQLGGIFQHAHNLFLDLILWAGLPIGLLLSAFLLRWFYLQFKRVATVEDALLLFFVGVFAWHAMLELPHQYAYMLLPVGLIMGIQDARGESRIRFKTHRLTFTSLWLAAATLLAVVTHDYFRIEADFQALRFERQYGMPAPKKPPETLVLSQLEAFIAMGRLEARSGMSQGQIDWMRKTAESFPSPANQYVYMAALALNDQADLAQKRMRILQKVMGVAEYEALGEIWTQQSVTNVQLAKTKWLSIATN